MHSRNPYASSPDFSALADAYPALKPHLIGLSVSNNKSTIDFKNAASQRCLTEALLSRDFGIQLRLPEGRLCPPVPNRLNYVLWIQDIVRAASFDQAPPIRGIDIGTGASVIYPLLACRLESNWEFTATEIDDTSVKYAHMNIGSNDMSDRVTILRVTPEEPILSPVLRSLVPFDFTMCNPPFYSSTEDVAQSAGAKEFVPNAVCTGAEVEMITPGGESAFVRQMVMESLTSRTKCRWYTSMLGKMSSLFDVVSLLREHSIDNYAITEFIQGQTRRWALAWSFGDIRLPDSIARIPNRDIQSLMPARNTLRQTFQDVESAEQLIMVLGMVLGAVEGVTISSASRLEDKVDHGRSFDSSCTAAVVVQAVGNTWSRAARRKQMGAEAQRGSAVLSATVPLRPPLLCSVGVCAEAGCFEVRFQWVRGWERSLFEGFCSHVSRKVASGLIVG